MVDDDEDEDEDEEDEKISVPLTITMTIIGVYIFFGALLFGAFCFYNFTHAIFGLSSQIFDT